MLLDELIGFEDRLRQLRSNIRKLDQNRVNRADLRTEAEALSVVWFTQLSPAVAALTIDLGDATANMSAAMNKLHQLSRPNNLSASYIKTLDSALTKFKDRFVKPIQLSPPEEKTNQVLAGVLAKISNPDESGYLTEAVACANKGFWRASVVLGWCATIDRMQQTIGRIGFDKFNAASLRLKNKTTGKYKGWNKGVQASNLSELQAIFDTDLIAVLEEMGLLDSNESDRLKVCFQYRNQSAHPAKPPILDVHLAAFYTDIDAIVFSNPRFSPEIEPVS